MTAELLAYYIDINIIDIDMLCVGAKYILEGASG